MSNEQGRTPARGHGREIAAITAGTVGLGAALGRRARHEQLRQEHDRLVTAASAYLDPLEFLESTEPGESEMAETLRKTAAAVMVRSDGAIGRQLRRVMGLPPAYRDPLGTLNASLDALKTLGLITDEEPTEHVHWHPSDKLIGVLADDVRGDHKLLVEQYETYREQRIRESQAHF